MRLIRQTEASDCALACLAMVASHHSHHLDLSDLRRRFPVGANGATLAQLMRCAALLEMSARPLRLELEMLDRLQVPCILHWDLHHFVVLERVRRRPGGQHRLTIMDPARGQYTIPLAAASRHFSGVALELTPTALFQPKDDRRRLSIAQLAGPISGLRRAVAHALLMALGLEAIALCLPLFNQFVVDEVIVSGDRDLLTVLTIGFGLMVVIQTALGLARSWLLMRWNMDICLQWGTRVFAHLCRLSPQYFQKRHVGDIVSRFGSIGSIQSTLTSLMAESALDGLMAVLAAAMMLLYSPRLSLFVLGAVLAYAALRWCFYAPLRQASQERLELAARESSFFLESVRAALPIKLFGQEHGRCARWQDLKLDVINRDVQTQKLGAIFNIAHTFIFAVQGLALFYLGAGLVMQSVLSIGMLLAFGSYAATFSGRALTLIDLVINLKMLNMHAGRLADIVLEPAEAENGVESDMSHLHGSISLRNVRFRHAPGEPWLLDGIDLELPAGHSLSVSGASGSGKTTLCKILLGLLTPSEGEVLVDGIPINRLGLRQYRQLLGTVMQDDTLLAGSILDNIAFFTADPERDRIQHCARLAAVHKDIIAMPMGYQTLVGDMGSTLSGGQRQRILLARALYKQPKVLVLDEASSHLDADTEEHINRHLAAMNITRIVISHRTQTIAAAQHRIRLEHGKIVAT